MELKEALDVVRAQPRAVLSTWRADGRPQMSPVLVSVGDDDRLVMSTRETAFKTKNLIRDPRASLCVLPDTFFGRWIQVDCSAELVHLPDAMDLLIEYYRSLSGEHPDWDEYRAAMRSEQRLAVLFTIERAGPDRAG
jgi:PPOX class probable F420-dependent enzyme